MKLIWQPAHQEEIGSPYLWCHICESTIDDGGLVITADNWIPGKHWIRLCLECLDEINTYMIKIIKKEKD